jgi:hypothetical protein
VKAELTKTEQHVDHHLGLFAETFNVGDDLGFVFGSGIGLRDGGHRQRNGGDGRTEETGMYSHFGFGSNDKRGFAEARMLAALRWMQAARSGGRNERGGSILAGRLIACARSSC